MNQALKYVAITATAAMMLLLLPTYANANTIKDQELDFIVAVEGKAFFSQRTTVRTWALAEALCKSVNMNLASITTRAQFNALEASFSPEFFGGFWTAGRDADRLRQFSWDETDSQPSGDLDPVFRRMTSAKRSCMKFHLVEEGAYLYSADCSVTSGTLCKN